MLVGGPTAGYRAGVFDDEESSLELGNMICSLPRMADGISQSNKMHAGR